MVRLITIVFCTLLLNGCFSTAPGMNPPAQPLIDKINAKQFTARNLVDQAETKRAQAKEKTQPADRAEHDRLIDETAKLYNDACDDLREAAQAADELAKLKTPPWYEEYFTLQAKLMRNIAFMGSQAHDELLIRKTSQPSQSQIQSWLEQLTRIKKENETYRQRIAAIETRERTAPIKH